MQVNLADETFKHTETILEDLKKNGTIPYNISEENSILPLIASLIIQEKQKVNVLDLGGGMGIGFIGLVACLEKNNNLQYSVIETPNMCLGGSKLFISDNRIQFYNDFPENLLNVDIVFIKSALQYF
ncbi:MAG: hypothetical protein U5K54_06425 [Cytophagales bacterium]|nr:hypothetical protein [Cytophagales bacterium]